MTAPEQTFWVNAALAKLESDKPLPLTVAFLPTSLDDRPDTDSASVRGQVKIETQAAREEAIRKLQEMKSVPA